MPQAIVQLKPFSSLVQPEFWHELKLDVLHLSDDAEPSTTQSLDQQSRNRTLAGHRFGFTLTAGRNSSTGELLGLWVLICTEPHIANMGSGFSIQRRISYCRAFWNIRVVCERLLLPLIHRWCVCPPNPPCQSQSAESRTIVP
jgi:hypothetical protein